MWKMFGITIGTEKVVVLLILMILAVQDVRKKQLPTVGLITLIILAAGWQIFTGNILGKECLAGALAGAAFLGISKLTREAIGYGDSLLILGLGIHLGIWNLFCVLSAAFGSAAIWAVVKLTVHKIRKKESFPFVPCLAIGYLVYIVCG